MVKRDAVQERLQFDDLVGKVEGSDAAANYSFYFRAGGISLFAARQPHQLDYHFLADDKLQVLAKIVDLVSNQHMSRILLLLLHSDRLLVLSDGLLYLILAAADLEVDVGELVLESIEFLVVHLY